MKRNKLLIVSWLVLALPLFGTAQTSSVSPYSRFGPGDLLFKGFAHQRGMGGTSIAEMNVARLNFSNPASYSYDTLMVFEIGLSGERIWLDQGDLSSKKWNAKLEYLVIGLPLVRNKMGLAFGFIPYSGTGYEIESSTTIDSSNVLSTTYKGAGGYNRYFIGTGVKLTPKLALGINASYLFGSLEQSRIAKYSNSDYFGTRVKDNTSIGDFMFDAGLSYKTPLKKGYSLSLGASASISQQLKANRTLLWENFKLNSIGIDFSRDTIEYKEKEQGEILLPLALGFGMQLAKDEKWLIQSDIHYTEWSSYESFRGKDSLKNTFRVSLGGQFVRDSRGTSFGQRVQYRAGLYYGTSFLNIRNNTLVDQGVSIGFGLPIRKAFQSMVNIAIEAGQMGTLDDNLIRERYIRAVIGLTFNEVWFQKRRFD